ncbi:AEC family transporter [Amphritea balenae]|uniref:AEC family transporter n=1 Tax=Amphritea balenae TaxID=452629 RepID=A0A3P1SWL3_9GAMM|nr:AEC family transporter [Amphritea balenae]RRD01579.1 AEC family transporter [Amphritea balenae]GGK55775.1 transporter [Amphritea balenae]
MPVAIEALIPITLTVLIGYLARHHFAVGEGVWNGLEKLTYYLFAPALLIASLANKPLQGLAWVEVLLTLVSVLLLSSLLIIIWQYFIRPVDMPSFTSMFQGGVRFNSFVVLALAFNLFGDEGLMVGALATVVIVISVNLLSVLVFSLSNNQLGGWRKLPRQLMTNPLILGCLAGLSLNLSGIGLTPVLDNLLQMLGKTALPMALLAVGAALQLGRIGSNLDLIAITSVIQFFIKPVAALLIGQWFGLEGMVIVIIVIAMAVPTAPSAYVLARQLGGNYQAMASIITVQALLAFFTLPLTLSLILPAVDA